MNKLGFGFLRLPKNADRSTDFTKLNQLVDMYMASGNAYFDTAYTYLNGKSEIALRESLVNRYPRESFQIATKLPGYNVKCPEDCYRFFEEELERCGVDYFDVYMLHWLNEEHYQIAERYGEFEFLQELKATGKARKIGFSFHDSAEVLDRILTAHPEVDYVLIQVNYLDWDSESIQSRKCYETCVKHHKKVIVMEPVKGGTLAKIPEKAMELLVELDSEASAASYAIRFAESLPEVEIVLSGMNDIPQMEENLKEREPLTEEEKKELEKVAAIINQNTAVPCSGCGYCVKGCPQNICIPNYFRLYNDISRNPKESWKISPAYDSLAREYGKASDCIGCKQCESHCPQGIEIIEVLKKVSDCFEV